MSIDQSISVSELLAAHPQVAPVLERFWIGPDDGEPEYLVNEAALEALWAITGQDFDYSKKDWRKWWATNKKSIPEWAGDEKKPGKKPGPKGP